MNKEIIIQGPLLNEKGELIEKGYAKSLIKDYDRTKIKAGKLRIKEWDYYLIINKHYAVALTVDDNSYMGLLSASFIDFSKPSEITKSYIHWFTNGKRNLPYSSKKGDIIVNTKQAMFSYVHKNNKRILDAVIYNFHNNKPFECHFELSNEPQDSIVMLTPFEEDKKAFYYNQKIVGFKTKGFAKMGSYEVIFNEEDTRGILDWGRGVWTYKNTWYWGSAATTIDGNEIGFNIGYGFGDTSNGSENSVFYNGVMHKLDQVTFNIPKDEKGNDDFLSPWTFTSNDGRFEMNFTPILDRKSITNVGIICSKQHQVFGLFNGTITLDNNKKIEVKNMIGFAEKVFNKW